MIVNTSLTTNTEPDTSISSTCVKVNSWTNTGIPTQVRDSVNVEMSLIKSG